MAQPDTAGTLLLAFYATYRQESTFPCEKALSFQRRWSKTKAPLTRGLDEKWFAAGLKTTESYLRVATR
jgi:hypothetical protein